MSGCYRSSGPAVTPPSQGRVQPRTSFPWRDFCTPESFRNWYVGHRNLHCPSPRSVQLGFTLKCKAQSSAARRLDVVASLSCGLVSALTEKVFQLHLAAAYHLVIC